MDHVFKCDHKEACKYWEEGINEPEVFLKKKSTALLIILHLKADLVAWM